MQEMEKCKILMLGQSAVGKTSIFRRFAGNPNEKVTPTIGAQYKQKIVDLGNGKQIKIQLWDTAGTERYRTISPIYYRNLDGVLLVFDITDSNSFRGLQYWIEQLNQKGQQAQIVLVGNKNDEQERRQITKEKAMQKAQQLKISYFQTSSLNEQSVRQIFEHLVRKIIQKRQNPKENLFLSKKSQFQSLRATDLPRKRSNKQEDCC